MLIALGFVLGFFILFSFPAGGAALWGHSAQIWVRALYIQGTPLSPPHRHCMAVGRVTALPKNGHS